MNNLIEILLHPILAIRSLIFYLGYASCVIILGSLIPFIGPFIPFEKRFLFIQKWPQFTLWWFSIICRVKYEVSGLENINHFRQTKTPANAIILANHQCTWETCFLQTIVQPSSTAVKKELMAIPFFGWGLRYLNPLIIDRNKRTNALKQLLNQGRQRLAEGNWVVLFPEGTRVTPGEVSQFTIGGAMLSSQTGFPIFPVAHNAGQCWPPHLFIKRPGTIKIEIGPLIEPGDLKPKQLNQLVENWIKTKLNDFE